MLCPICGVVFFFNNTDDCNLPRPSARRISVLCNMYLLLTKSDTFYLYIILTT